MPKLYKSAYVEQGGLSLTKEQTQSLFNRTGEITSIEVVIEHKSVVKYK